MSRPKFSLLAGMQVQQSQFADWCKRLNRVYIKALLNECITRNTTLADDADDYAVWRGTSMDEFIHNYNEDEN